MRKYRIEKGTKVICHLEGSEWHIQTGFTPYMPTDVTVTFEPGDVWFLPDDHKSECPAGTGTDQLRAANLHAPEKHAAIWFEHTMTHFYGFNVPKNKKKIDRIIVEKSSVEIIDEESQPMSHVQIGKQAIRRLHRDGKHFFPGYIPK